MPHLHGESHRNLLKVQCFCLISVSLNRSLPISVFFFSLPASNKSRYSREQATLFTLSPVEEEEEEEEDGEGS